MAETKKAEDSKTTTTPTPDPTGEVANGGSQREPKPEDYPVSARVAPPLEQVNPALAPAVGTIVGKDDGVKALEDGIDAHAKSVDKSNEKATRIAELRRELDDEMAS